MPAKAYVVHRTRGRVRLRIPERRGDHRFLGEVAERLRHCRGVHGVEATPATGSVLIHHDVDALEQLIVEAAANGVGELIEPIAALPPVARRLREEVTAVDRAVRRATGGTLDAATVAALGLMGLAAIQLVRGGQPVRAISLSWYAAELLRRWSEPKAAG